MFEGDGEAKTKADKIVAALSDTETHKAHERHIAPSTCIELGMRIKMLEEDNTLQDLVLTIHHCFMHTLMNSAAFKIIENHLGTALVKTQQAQQIQLMPTLPAQPQK